jgi:hypothetical protein
MTVMGAIDRLNGPCAECGPPTRISGQITRQENLSFAGQADKGGFDFCSVEVRFSEESGTRGDAFPFQLRGDPEVRTADTFGASFQKRSVNRIAKSFSVDIFRKHSTSGQSDLLGPITHYEAIVNKCKNGSLKTQPRKSAFAGFYLFAIVQTQPRDPVSAAVMNAHASAIF